MLVTYTMRACLAINTAIIAWSALAHPVPDIPVRGFFKSDGTTTIQVEIDPRCFEKDPENTPYLQNWATKEMTKKERDEFNAQAGALIARSVHFRFEPVGQFNPEFLYRYATLGGKPLGKDIETPVVILAEWKTKIPRGMRGYRIKALPKGKFSVNFVNFLDGKPQDLNVLFPGETSYELDLTKLLSGKTKTSTTVPQNQVTNGLRSFIYVTRREVRHEFLVPLLTFEKWLRLERKNPDFLEIPEQAQAHATVETFFRKNNLVEIDGLTVKPKLTRLNFYGPDVTDFNDESKPQRISVPQARIGLIITYAAPQSLRTVKMTWAALSPQVPNLRATIFTEDQAPKEHVFSKGSEVLNWKTANLGVTANVTAVRHKLGNKLTEQDASKIFTQLHANIYGAFGLRDDRAIYDALSAGVDGDLLRSLFLQFKRSLVMTEQGGAMSRVKSVKIMSGRMKPARNGFVYVCTWRAVGTVEHWGHAHTRENEYEGTFTVAATSSGWKITDYELRRQKRVKYENTSRNFSSRR